MTKIVPHIVYLVSLSFVFLRYITTRGKFKIYITNIIPVMTISAETRRETQLQNAKEDRYEDTSITRYTLENSKTNAQMRQGFFHYNRNYL